MAQRFGTLTDDGLVDCVTHCSTKQSPECCSSFCTSCTSSLAHNCISFPRNVNQHLNVYICIELWFIKVWHESPSAK